jgi:hypothetical protein
MWTMSAAGGPPRSIIAAPTLSLKRAACAFDARGTTVCTTTATAEPPVQFEGVAA